MHGPLGIGKGHMGSCHKELEAAPGIQEGLEKHELCPSIHTSEAGWRVSQNLWNESTLTGFEKRTTGISLLSFLSVFPPLLPSLGFFEMK